MEKRQNRREDAFSSIHLFEKDGGFICTADIDNISEAGVHVIFLHKDDFQRLAPHKHIFFKLIIPTGEVEGSASIVWTRVRSLTIGLRFLEIQNSDGMPNLLAFINNDFI